MGQKVVQLPGIPGRDADEAHADGKTEARIILHPEGPDVPLDPGEQASFALPLGAHGQDGEFVAADPADDVGLADDLPQGRRDALQEQVADGVAVGVVDLFEIVDIEEDEVAVLLEPFGDLQLLEAEGEEAAAVVEPGQIVRLGQALVLLFAQLELRSAVFRSVTSIRIPSK
jgi:hypothetical protein